MTPFITRPLAKLLSAANSRLNRANARAPIDGSLMLGGSLAGGDVGGRGRTRTAPSTITSLEMGGRGEPQAVRPPCRNAYWVTTQPPKDSPAITGRSIPSASIMPPRWSTKVAAS